MKYSGIINCTIVDGEGFRVALYVSGCKHKCEGCHNVKTWAFDAGKEFTQEVEDILFDRLSKPYIKGLTLTGGDPLFSADEILGVVKIFRERFGNTKDIWLYTGFTMDEIKNLDESQRELVNLCDYIVDGKFVLSKRNTALPFRGSENQIIWKKNLDGEFFESELN
nr:MAG TPA: anaerobic ribonucleoside-triphosphate reductase activating protein [Herelleviridae sp.]